MKKQILFLLGELETFNKTPISKVDARPLARDLRSMMGRSKTVTDPTYIEFFKDLKAICKSSKLTNVFDLLDLDDKVENTKMPDRAKKDSKEKLFILIRKELSKCSQILNTYQFNSKITTLEELKQKAEQLEDYQPSKSEIVNCITKKYGISEDLLEAIQKDLTPTRTLTDLNYHLNQELTTKNIPETQKRGILALKMVKDASNKYVAKDVALLDLTKISLEEAEKLAIKYEEKHKDKEEAPTLKLKKS